MLEVVNLRKVYPNEVVAVDGLNLAVSEGEVFVLLGANGAGKTTTIMCCLGLTEPTEGDILIDGVSMVKEPLEAKKHVAYVPENAMLYGSLSARQNLMFFGALSGRGKVRRQECNEAMSRVGLSERSFEQRVRTFSKGMRQRLAIAIALMKEADVILLDEPTSGLDPEGARAFLELLRDLRRDNRAVLMSSHDLFRTRQVADTVGVMSKGKLVQTIKGDAVRTENLEELYLKYVEA